MTTRRDFTGKTTATAAASGSPNMLGQTSQNTAKAEHDGSSSNPGQQNARLVGINPNDVSAGDLWLFPAGAPHSIQGLESDGCEFLLVFNQGSFSEESTFLLLDWLKHTPPEIIAKNTGLSKESIAKLPKEDPLYIFASDLPTQSLEQDRSEVGRNTPKPKVQYTFKASTMAPTFSSEKGNVKIVDRNNFPASTNISGGIVTLKPGSIRQMHWHPNASEWQFWMAGQGRMTVFNAKEDARTMDFRANDVGFVPAMAGHYIENTGAEDLIFLELFPAGEFQEMSLNHWLRALPRQVAMAHTNLTAAELLVIPEKSTPIL